MSNSSSTSMVARQQVRPIFTVDLEDYYHALIPQQHWGRYENRLPKVLPRLLRLLHQYRIKALFYVLGYVAMQDPALIQLIHRAGHQVGSHGWSHQHAEREGDSSDQHTRNYLGGLLNMDYTTLMPYRSPYWDTTPRPGYSGGAYFRILPYVLFKWELQHSGMFWIHPHDLDPDQPHIPQAPWWRYIHLNGAWNKLERLMSEVSFARLY